MENNKEIIVQRLNELKDLVEQKKGRFFFLVSDTNGTPMASIEHIYKIAMLLKEEGYPVTMIHEKDKFIGVKDWMGKEYASLPHMSLSKMNNNKEFQINGADTFVIPELYSDFIKKLHESKLPSDTVVICQSHTFIFKYLNAGENWKYFGVENVITTSEKMKYFLEEYQPVTNTHIINPVITEDFKKSDKPQKPIISIIARHQDDIERVAKLFYQKYPMYSWISFKTLGNMNKADFASNLSETCLAVWVDDYATFGTFPLEAMASGVPVIIKIPDLIPEWAEVRGEDSVSFAENAIFVSNVLAIPDYIAKFVEGWLLGDIPPELYESMSKTPSKYSYENFKEQTLRTFRSLEEQKIRKIISTLKKVEDDTEQ